MPHQDFGLISRVVTTTTLPAMAVKPSTGTVVEANSAALLTLHNNSLLNTDLYTSFPNCGTPLHRIFTLAQKQGHAQGVVVDTENNHHVLSAVTFATDPNLLLVTLHPLIESDERRAAPLPPTTLPRATTFPPITLPASWQLQPPREKLRHVVESAVAEWNLAAAGLIHIATNGPVLIEKAGKDVTWTKLPLNPYSTLERTLQRGETVHTSLGNLKVCLAPLFLNGNDITWGAIALATENALPSGIDDAALTLAGWVSTTLAEAQHAHTIADHQRHRQRAVSQRDLLVSFAQRGVLLVNQDGNLESANEHACLLLNWSHQDVILRPFLNLLPTLGSLGTKIATALSHHPKQPVELSGRVERRAARGRDLDLTIHPILQEPGAYFILLTDPTSVLSGTTTPDETSQYLGRVTQLNVAIHEMRSPLAGMLGQLEKLQDQMYKSQLPEHSPVYETLATVRRQAERTLSIMDDLRGWVTTGQKPNFEFCDLKNISEEAIVSVEFERRGRLQRVVKFRRAFDPFVPLIEGDNRRLHQMMTNLIKNAAEAITKEDGEIEVLIRPLRRESLAHYALTPEKVRLLTNGIEIRVRDNGQGMTKAQMQRVFEAHVSFKLGGSGIGLWVVRTIVEQHRGEIFVESEQGKGTTFVLYLPQRIAGLDIPQD